MSGVYDGLTVVELADRRNQWAGKLLADGGARVIQIEPPAGGPGRWCGPFVDDKVDPDRCLDYWWYNTGKQSVALDIGRQPARICSGDCWRARTSFSKARSPGTLRPCGLDYGSVSSHRALIYTSLTDFGQDGPWRDYQMNDAAHLALGGHMASTGYSDPSVTPIGGQGHQAWHMGCVFALHGITLALFDRMTTGEGQYIDVSIHDACSIGTESAVPEWLYNGATLYRQTGMHARARRQPGLELPTADGMYVIAVNQTFGDQGWAKLIEWMEEKGVAGELTDPKYRDEAVRIADYRQGTAVRDGIRRLIAASKGEEVFTARAVVRHLVGGRPRARGELRRPALPAARLLAHRRAPGDRPRHSLSARPVHVGRARDRAARTSAASRGAHAAGSRGRPRPAAAQSRCARRRGGDSMNAPRAARHPERRPHPRLHVEDRRAVGPAPAHALRRRGHPRRARRILGRSPLRGASEPDRRGPAEGVHVGAGHRSAARRRSRRRQEALLLDAVLHDPAPRQAGDQPQHASSQGPRAGEAAHRHLGRARRELQR